MEPHFQWWLIAPEITVAATGVLTLALDLLFPTRPKLSRNVPWFGLPLAAALSLWLALSDTDPDTGYTAIAGFQNTFQTPGALNLIFIFAAMAALGLGEHFFSRKKLPAAEFRFLVPVATAALMLLQGSRHFILFFTALETATTGLCVLTAYNRRSIANLEAGLKYLLTAGISGALLLFGIVLLYGAAGNPALFATDAAGDALHFDVLKNFIAANPTHPFVLVGAALVTVGLAFKIGLAPFHLWVPDVYQGASTPVTAFFASASKFAGILALMLLLQGPFSALVLILDGKPGPLLLLLGILVALTFALATITALGQSNTKRLMGLSGLSHAAFLTLIVLANVADSNPSSIAIFAFYAVAYLAANTTVFGVMKEIVLPPPPFATNTLPETNDDTDADTLQSTSDFQLLRERHPFLCGTLCVGLASLAGIPPTAGFFAKALVLGSTIACAIAVGPSTPAGTLFWILSATALLAACGGVYYYFAWMREAFQRHWIPEERRKLFAATPLTPSVATRLTLLALSATLLLLGALPALLSFLSKTA